MKPLVMVIDDHPLYQKALAMLVRDTGGADEVLSAFSAEEGLRLIRDGASPALILLDLGLPGINGAEAVREFRRIQPGAVIVIVSATEHRQEAAAAARAGANAMVSKGVDMDVLRDIVVQALAGNLQPDRKWLTPVATRSFDAKASLRLTTRQAEIVALVSRGLSNKEIGLRLGLAEITVKTHLSAVFRALGVTNRTQAVMALRSLGLAEVSQTPQRLVIEAITHDM
jgi:DNA-binding NarL/FixJ family response regulator